MILYVDVLFLHNYVMTFLLLLITAEVLMKEYQIKRIAWACLIETIITILLYLYDLEKSFFFQGFALLEMVFIAFPHRTKKQYVIIMAGILIMTFLLGGVSRAAFQNPVEMIIVGAFCTVCMCQYTRYYQRKKWKTRNLYELEMVIENQKICLKAFLDTGNFLTVGLHQTPVVIVSKMALKGKVSLILENFLERGKIPNNQSFHLQNMQFVEWEGIGNQKEGKWGMKVKNVIVKNQPMVQKRDIVIVITQKTFDGYDALIGLSVLEGGKLDGNFATMEQKSQEIYC